MKVIKAPQPLEFTGRSIFLAGGITNCWNWQNLLTQFLSDTSLTIVNPRRDNWNPKIENKEQIEWEFHALRKASMISFWFSYETVQPITLYELGTWTVHHTDKPIYIGCHPNYSRREDVLIQTKLVRPDIEIVDNLVDLSKQIKELV